MLEGGGVQCWRVGGANIGGSELPQLWNPWGTTQNILVPSGVLCDLSELSYFPLDKT